MTSCYAGNIGNLCLIADKSDICPCISFLPLLLIILGLALLLIILSIIITKYSQNLKTTEDKDE